MDFIDEKVKIIQAINYLNGFEDVENAFPHLETMPPEEREKKVKEIREEIKEGNN